MAQDVGFWNWSVDTAVSHSHVRGWAVTATALYVVGAALLLSLMLHAVPALVGKAGTVLVLMGVAASVAALVEVVYTRDRLHHG